MNPRVWKEILHRFLGYKATRLVLEGLFTALYGSCEILGSDSDTETTTELNIFVETGEISTA